MDNKTKNLIEKINNKFGNQYDYSNTVWKPNRQKIELKCIKHNHIFFQRSDLLMLGHGCQKCGRESSAIKHTYSRNNFLSLFNEIHGNKYDLNKINFINYKEKVSVYCEKHGYFEKKASDFIIRKRGCPKCSNRVRKTKEEFITQAINVYGNIFDYSLIDYKNSKTKIKIICNIHGIFEQTPKEHLRGVIGCQKCAIDKISISRPEKEWLDSLNIFERNIRIKIDNKRPICVDGIDRLNKCIYLFHGDFWHGNPKFYPPDLINPKAKKTFGELYQKTLDTEKRIQDSGYKLIVMWESNWTKTYHSRYIKNNI